MMIMIKAADIRDLRTAAADYQETEAIKARLAAKLRTDRCLYLTLEEFNRIARWKLGRQWGRVSHLLVQSPQHLIEETTHLALSECLDDPEYELEFRFRILTSLRGVGTGIASAILALSYPDKYCVIDFRGWYQVFERNKREFSIGDYKHYHNEIMLLAEELQWPPQEVDIAIWEYDKNDHPSKK